MAASVVRIRVRLAVGDSRMAASDDPLFLGVRGVCGREFRLEFKKGRSRRRGKVDLYVLGSAEDPDTNVAHPEFNDPNTPVIAADSITSVYLRKGFEPIPNVRAVAEMDDRLEVLEASVETETQGGAQGPRFARKGPIWLGLVAGLRFELGRADGSG